MLFVYIFLQKKNVNLPIEAKSSTSRCQLSYITSPNLPHHVVKSITTWPAVSRIKKAATPGDARLAALLRYNIYKVYYFVLNL